MKEDGDRDQGDVVDEDLEAGQGRDDEKGSGRSGRTLTIAGPFGPGRAVVESTGRASAPDQHDDVGSSSIALTSTSREDLGCLMQHPEGAMLSGIRKIARKFEERSSRKRQGHVPLARYTRCSRCFPADEAGDQDHPWRSRPEVGGHREQVGDRRQADELGRHADRHRLELHRYDGSHRPSSVGDAEHDHPDDH